MATRPKRKTFRIHLKAQGPFFLKLSAIWAGGVALLCLLLYYLADEELGRSFYSVHLRIRNTWDILLPAVLVSAGISFLATMAATFLFAVHASARLGGPALKFRALFQQLAEGRLDADFRFRKGDLLSELGESYRAALVANRDRIARLQELSLLLERKTVLLRDKVVSADAAGEDASLAAESASLAAEIREAASAFRAGAA